MILVSSGPNILRSQRISSFPFCHLQSLASSSHLSLDCKMTTWVPGIIFIQVNPQFKKVFPFWYPYYFRRKIFPRNLPSPTAECPKFLNIQCWITSPPLKLSLARKMAMISFDYTTFTPWGWRRGHWPLVYERKNSHKNNIQQETSGKKPFAGQPVVFLIDILKNKDPAMLMNWGSVWKHPTPLSRKKILYFHYLLLYVTG